MHTKGKLSYLRSKRKHKESLFIITDAYKNDDMFVGKVYGFGVHDEVANAARLVKCWNMHDELVGACNGLVVANQHVRALSLNREEPHRGMMWGEARSILDAARLKAEQITRKAEQS